MNSNNEVQKKNFPPYVSYKTFSNTLEEFKSDIPSVIDKSVLSSMSGSTYGALISALQVMKLIDIKNVPTEKFKNLVKSVDGERKEILKQVFESVYDFLAEDNINTTQMTINQLNAKLSLMGATGATIKKCRSFFLALAKDSDIELSPFLTKVVRTRTNNSKFKAKKTPSKKKSHVSEDVDEEFNGSSRSFSELLYDILDPDIMNEEEQKAVWTLMLYLKKQDSISEE